MVTHSNLWDIFADGTVGLNWHVDWLGAPGQIPGLEIQAGYANWTPASGHQFTELDSYAAVKIWQDIATIPGKVYELSYAFSARPDTALTNNVLEASAGGNVLATHSADGSGLTNTAWATYTNSFTASEVTTRIQFSDLGTPSDSLGTFLDATSLKCVPPTEEKNACGDGIDNDQDGKIDSEDSDCSPGNDGGGTGDVTPPPPPPSPPAVTGGGAGGNGPPVGSFGAISLGGGGPITPPPSRQVLGASIRSVNYLNDYIFAGRSNNPVEVRKLQVFLNETLGLKLTVNGIYDRFTIAGAYTVTIPNTADTFNFEVFVKPPKQRIRSVMLKIADDSTDAAPSLSLHSIALEADEAPALRQGTANQAI